MSWSTLSVLITGGTGSFGKKFIQVMLGEYHPKKLIIFSRDELKQHEMRVAGFDHDTLRYFIGDVRDRDRLKRAMKGVDIVVHAAALKQVPACEYNPIEAVATNIGGAKNVIDAALDADVKKVLGLSTDKAVNPVNLYGPTSFSCVRYGNVVGSRGSVIPLFRTQRCNGRVTITDARMTRFWITLDQGVRFVIRCIEQMHGGEVFVPKIPSMNIVDLANAIAPDCRIEETGIRPGEKMHEVLLSEDEARHSVELDTMFVIRPAHPWWANENWAAGCAVPDGFRYTSDGNPVWLSLDELRVMAGEEPAC